MDREQNVLLLRNLIEKSMDKKMETAGDFLDLFIAIEDRLNETLSLSTLKRIWGYIGGYSSIREKTLDVLSRFVGYPDFKTFEIEYCSSEEAYSSQRLFSQTLVSEDLKVKDIVEIRWNPNRICHLRYLGESLFEVIDSQNSKLCKGDTFKCTHFHLNQPLILLNYLHKDQPLCKFVVGGRGGLTIARVIKINE